MTTRDLAVALSLFPRDGHWSPVKRDDIRARLLADDHYSRQTPGAKDFLSSGQTLVLLTADELAVWGVIYNRPPKGAGYRFRVAIFRNDGPVLSSELVREATDRTYVYWKRHYGGVPNEGLTTEVDPRKVRRKRDPGRCFVRAGWRRRPGLTRGLVVLDAPAPLRVGTATEPK
jgi:hypothetical protein